MYYIFAIGVEEKYSSKVASANNVDEINIIIEHLIRECYSHESIRMFDTSYSKTISFSWR